MNKNLFKKSLIAVATTLVINSAHANDSELVVNVYNWSDYIDESILEDFTKETGIKVVYDVFDANEMLEAKLLAGSTGYDLVFPSHNFLQRQIKAGVFQKLDKTQLPNLVNIDPQIQSKMSVFDPDNAYSVTYMWGTAGIGYNVDMIKERLGDQFEESWRLIFDPEITAKLKDCGIVWSDTSEVMIPQALAYIGLNPLSIEQDDLNQAAEMMGKARQDIRKFDASEYVSSLANGDICITAGYSGDVLQAKDRADEAGKGINIQYIVPKEGGQLWFDQMAIPADAPHAKEAHALINYLLRPDVIAKASNYVSYANANTKAKDFMDEDIINNKAIYPSSETQEKLWVQPELNNKEQRRVNRVWTKVKSGI